MFVETEVRPQGEPAKVRTLKLSEAMRIGARIRPQCHTAVFSDDGRSCALGAAWEGVGFSARENPGQMPFSSIAARLGIVELLAREIAHKNDGGMTREQIADWLESQGY